MTRSISRISAICTALALIVLAGCSHYHIGSVAHPQLKTVSVGKVKNATTQPRLGPMTQTKIVSEFAKDGSLRLASADTADCVLHVEISDVEYDDVGRRRNQSVEDEQQVYITDVFAAQVVVKYWVTVPGRREPVIGPHTVVGRSEFSDLPDLDIARRDAWDVATADAAKKVVYGVTEGW